MTESAPRPAVLLVDDDAGVVSALARVLRPTRRPILTANDALAAAAQLSGHEVGVVVCEPRHPDLAAFLIEVRQNNPAIVRIVLTGYPDLTGVVKAFNEARPFKLLFKPCNDDELVATVKLAFEQYAVNRKRQVLLDEYDGIRAITRRGHAYRMIDALMLSLVPAIDSEAIARLPVGALLLTNGVVTQVNPMAQRFLLLLGLPALAAGVSESELVEDLSALFASPHGQHLSRRLSDQSRLDYFVQDIAAGTLLVFAPTPQTGYPS